MLMQEPAAPFLPLFSDSLSSCRGLANGGIVLLFSPVSVPFGQPQFGRLSGGQEPCFVSFASRSVTGIFFFFEAGALKDQQSLVTEMRWDEMNAKDAWTSGR
jgi:hypothetical protein